MFAIGAVGGRSTPDATANDSNENDSNEKMDDDRALTAKPQGPGPLCSGSDKNAFSDKLMQKRILRKVCRIDFEIVVTSILI